jgi:hypothetical protein
MKFKIGETIRFISRDKLYMMIKEANPFVGEQLLNEHTTRCYKQIEQFKNKVYHVKNIQVMDGYKEEIVTLQEIQYQNFGHKFFEKANCQLEFDFGEM